MHRDRLIPRPHKAEPHEFKDLYRISGTMYEADCSITGYNDVRFVANGKGYRLVSGDVNVVFENGHSFLDFPNGVVEEIDPSGIIADIEAYIPTSKRCVDPPIEESDIFQMS